VVLYRHGDPQQAVALGEVPASAWCVAFAPDGRTLAVGCGDLAADVPGRVVLWDADTQARLAEFEAHDRGVLGLAFTTDGRALVTAGRDGLVRVWSLPVGVEPKPAAQLGRAGGPARTALALAADGRTLADGGADGSVRLWSAAWQPAGPELGRADGVVRGLAFLPGGRLAAALDAGPQARSDVRIWDLATGRPAFAIPAEHGEPNYPFRALALAPDGRTLVGLYESPDHKGVVRLYDLDERRHSPSVKRPGDYSTHWLPANALALAPDGRALASGGDDANVMVWVPRD
jgi:WD40 repeat protein